MKKTFCMCVAALAVMLSSVPAAAQAPAGPVVTLGYGGLVTGTGSVHKTGGVIGGEAGARVWRNLDLLLEGGSISNVVPEDQIDRGAPLTAFLEQVHGEAATVSVKMPATYFSLGGRWVFEEIAIGGWARPYVHFGIGGARVKREPTFTLGGADVTSALSQYGVELGADFTATERRATVTGGLGVVVPFRMLYVDFGYRLTTIRTSDAINVSRLNLGIGARF